MQVNVNKIIFSHRDRETSTAVSYSLDQAQLYHVPQTTPSRYEQPMISELEQLDQLSIRAGDESNASLPVGAANRNFLELVTFDNDITHTGFGFINALNNLLMPSGDFSDVSGVEYFYSTYLPTALPRLSGRSYLYAAAPFAKDYQRLEPTQGERFMRVYRHGWCSAYYPWSFLWDKVAAQFSSTVACSVADSGYSTDIRALGFFPYFSDNPERGTRGKWDGFGVYGGLKVPGVFGGLVDVGVSFQGEYIMGVQDGVVTVTPEWYDATGSEVDGIHQPIEQAMRKTIPDGVAASINKSLLQVIPGNIQLGENACGRGKTYCGTPVRCGLVDPELDQLNCAKSAQDSLTLGLISALGPGFDKLIAKSVAEFLPSDFICKPAPAPEDCDDGTVPVGSCLYRIPVTSVNVYPDSFELVFREASDPSALDPVATLAKITEDAAPFCQTGRVTSDSNTFVRQAGYRNYAGQNQCIPPVCAPAVAPLGWLP
jgi:hypothetical protein